MIPVNIMVKFIDMNYEKLRLDKSISIFNEEIKSVHKFTIHDPVYAYHELK